mmetsp:Transcript_37249/g.106392  ORF Transcript_37249/g.106392 Transcript_37249/m.106392 type:complete len:207 (-) Transcript_37249:549-1169(-)
MGTSSSTIGCCSTASRPSMRGRGSLVPLRSPPCAWRARSPRRPQRPWHPRRRPLARLGQVKQRQTAQCPWHPRRRPMARHQGRRPKARLGQEKQRQTAQWPWHPRRRPMARHQRRRPQARLEQEKQRPTAQWLPRPPPQPRPTRSPRFRLCTGRPPAPTSSSGPRSLGLSRSPSFCSSTATTTGRPKPRASPRRTAPQPRSWSSRS